MSAVPITDSTITADDVLSYLRSCHLDHAPSNSEGQAQIYMFLSQVEKVAGESKKLCREAIEAHLSDGVRPEFGGRVITWEKSTSNTFDWKGFRDDYATYWKVFGHEYLTTKEVQKLVVRAATDTPIDMELEAAALTELEVKP